MIVTDAGGGRPVLQRAMSDTPLIHASVFITRHRLRIVAYHGVPDPVAFDNQLRLLDDRYNLVGLEEVAAAAAGGEPLPPRALWITFDDGMRSAVDNGLAVLEKYAARATLFVCPGLVAAGEPYWWRLVGEAFGSERARQLKTVDDDERRQCVSAAKAVLPAATVEALATEVADVGLLRRWVDAGHSIGNHTWDHPCLDRCTEDDQAQQISSASEWLIDQELMPRPVFAYPNGDWTPAAETALAARGYPLALLFDHRLAKLDVPLRLSRLRLDSAASGQRALAVTGGLHSGLFQLSRRALAFTGRG